MSISVKNEEEKKEKEENKDKKDYLISDKILRLRNYWKYRICNKKR